MSLRKQIFDLTHNIAHISFQRTFDQIHEKYVWPGMRRDVSNWCKTCTTCQQSKVTLHTKAPLSTFEKSNPFSFIHLDLVGPLPQSNGFKYLLTIIERYTHWFEAIPLSSITTQNVISSFTHTWISRFGTPTILVTDRGPQFTSHEFLYILQ